MKKQAVLGVAVALMLGACAKNSPKSPEANPQLPAQIETQFAATECSEQFVKDYLRVYKVDADLMNNRVYGNFSAMEDRINLVSVRNACETFYKNNAPQACFAKVEDAVWHVNTKDLEQICDKNRK